MSRIKISGYDPLLSDDPEVDVHIHISGRPPEFPHGKDMLDQASVWYDSQAELVASAILDNLSQGVVHCVLGILLERYASQYRGKTNT